MNFDLSSFGSFNDSPKSSDYNGWSFLTTQPED